MLEKVPEESLELLVPPHKHRKTTVQGSEWEEAGEMERESPLSGREAHGALCDFLLYVSKFHQHGVV